MKVLDRFDRMITAAELSARVVAEPSPPPPPPERAPRFVDYAACSLCGCEPLGVEYHGQLKSGAKVHPCLSG